MQDVAGPIIEALDENFIATSWDGMRIQPPVQPAVTTPPNVTP